MIAEVENEPRLGVEAVVEVVDSLWKSDGRSHCDYSLRYGTFAHLRFLVGSSGFCRTLWHGSTNHPAGTRAAGIRGWIRRELAMHGAYIMTTTSQRPCAPSRDDIPQDDSVEGRTFWSDSELRALVSLGRLYYAHALITPKEVKGWDRNANEPRGERSIGEITSSCVSLGRAVELVSRSQAALLGRHSQRNNAAPRCFTTLQFEHGDATGDNRPRCGTTIPHLHVITVEHRDEDQQSRLEQAILGLMRPDEGWERFNAPIRELAEENSEYLALGIARGMPSGANLNVDGTAVPDISVGDTYWWGTRVGRGGLPRKQHLRWLVWSALVNAGRDAPQRWEWEHLDDSTAAKSEADWLTKVTEQNREALAKQAELARSSAH